MKKNKTKSPKTYTWSVVLDNADGTQSSINVEAADEAQATAIARGQIERMRRDASHSWKDGHAR